MNLMVQTLLVQLIAIQLVNMVVAFTESQDQKTCSQKPISRPHPQFITGVYILTPCFSTAYFNFIPSLHLLSTGLYWRFLLLKVGHVPLP
jgi:hypothetical protein